MLVCARLMAEWTRVGAAGLLAVGSVDPVSREGEGTFSSISSCEDVSCEFVERLRSSNAGEEQVWVLIDWVAGCAGAACERYAAPSGGIAVSELLPRLRDGIAAVVVLLECWTSVYVVLLLCFFGSSG